MHDYHLHELGTSDFQDLTIHICNNILGIGTINFSEGKDGGRDGVFDGTAQKHPSTTDPWKGKFIIQAKRTQNPMASCSDAEFGVVIGKELPKIKKLVKAGQLENYLIFTNRKLSGIEHPKIIKYIKDKTSVKNAEIFGVEKITNILNANPEIVKACGLEKFRSPLRIHAEDIRDLIVAFYKNREQIASDLDGRHNFEYPGIEKKNELNKLSETYFNYMKSDSEPYFNEITLFLKKPQNNKYTEYYYNTTDELKGKIKIRRTEFDQFERVFEYLYDDILDKYSKLKPKRLINVFLHYMYCNCDIGEK